MNQDLEKLIELTLADGQLSEKERTVLFRKAKELGVDHDEFEIVLDAKLQILKEKSLKAKMIKCLSCGEPISGLVNVCPSCGYIIENKGINYSINLQDLVLKIEDDLRELKSIPHANFFKIIQTHIQYFLIIICVVLFFLALKIGTTDLGYGLIIIAGISGFLGVLSILRKFGEKDESTKKGVLADLASNSTFKEVKANFEKNNRLVNTYYGEDKKVKHLLFELKTEIVTIEKKRQKSTNANIFIYAVLGVIAVSIFFIPKSELRDETYQEKEQKEIQEKLGELKTKEYFISGSQLKTTGNFGSCYQIISTKATLNVDYSAGIYEGYIFSIKGIKLSLNKKDKKKLKSEISKVKTDCGYANENSCGEITATLNLEDEDNNSLGIANLELPYGADSDKKALFYSESDEVLLSFEGHSYSKKDVEKLANAKNYTISIIITKK
jgi:hypothetical protein